MKIDRRRARDATVLFLFCCCSALCSPARARWLLLLLLLLPAAAAAAASSFLTSLTDCSITSHHARTMTSSRCSSPTSCTSTGNAETPAPTLSHAGSAVSDSLLVSGSAEVAKRIFRAASAARLRQERASFVYERQWQQQEQQQEQHHHHHHQQQHPLPGRGEQAASDFARTASMAGYLHKLGSDVPILKRRFFVLRPCTLLYYFVGPNDVEPRGCIDLDDTTVGAIKTLTDGRCRFEINFTDRKDLEDYLESTGGDGGSRVQMGERNNRRIVLEAQSEIIGRQWIEALGTERLSHAKSVIEESRRFQADLGFKVDQLKRELEGTKALERERDAALDDVRLWKSRHASLDAGVRLLSRVIVRELGKGSDSSFNSDELLSQARREDEQRLLDLAIPNTGFASLRNAVEQLRSNLAQTAKEACLAAQDATERLSELNETMAQTETKMQQLLEENNAICEENTRRKRDNKILVKEVKSLRVQVEAKSMNADEASKLISELEGHVSSALSLRQRIVDTNDDDEKNNVLEEFCNTKSVNDFSSFSDGVAVDPIASKDDVGDVLPPGKRQLPLSVKEISLAEDAKSDISKPPRDGSDDGHRKDTAESHAVYEDDKSDDMKGKQLYGPSEANAIVTDTGHATSRLACPLIDVLSVSGNDKANLPSSSLRQEDMYHLTFYSQKIGLQFQKVPASSEPRGIVTSVVTADLGHTRSSGQYDEKNSAVGGDLERIAAIAQRTRSDNDASASAPLNDGRAKVAMPLDAVLVCGFRGFDESVNKARPDLGARLVAFDGMSVEIGEWTFDRIKRGIQSRSRPITLSFRNDKLSVHQREILTRAVAELNSSIPPRLLDRPSRSSSNRAPPAVEEDMSVQTFRSTLMTAPPSPGGNSVSYQSFSEMGGTSRSSEITSSLAPMMSGLITGFVRNKSLRDSKVDYADYAHSSPKHLGESLNSHISHHEFEASLL